MRHEVIFVHETFFPPANVQVLLSKEINLFSDPKTVLASITATGRDLKRNFSINFKKVK
jgi:hypothetical protein